MKLWGGIAMFVAGAVMATWSMWARNKQWDDAWKRGKLHPEQPPEVLLVPWVVGCLLIMLGAAAVMGALPLCRR